MTVTVATADDLASVAQTTADQGAQLQVVTAALAQALDDIAALQAQVSPGPQPVPVPAPTPAPPVPSPPGPSGLPAAPAGYRQVYVNDLTDLAAVNAWDSPAAVNALASPADMANKACQTPILARNTVVEDDSTASGGKALRVHVRQGTYQLPGGHTAAGLTAGRCQVGGAIPLPGTLWLARLRSGPTPGKFAVMVWPTKGWPWEIDLRERFDGGLGISVRHHSDLGKGGGAKPQIITDYPAAVLATDWHVFGVEFVSGDGLHVSEVRYTVDGTLVRSITDAQWMPQPTANAQGQLAVPPAGSFAIGSAVPPHRAGGPEHDAWDELDYLAVFRKG